MKSMHRLWGVFAVTLLVVGQALATPVLPEGTPITGNPTSLLGFDAGLNDYFAGGVSAVNDANIEFLTDDFALAIDFQSDGLLRLFDNLGTGDDVFNDALQFSFSGLVGSLNGIKLLDTSAVTAGNLVFNIIDNNTFSLTLRDVKFAPGFSHVDLALSVDEPPMWALFAFAMVSASVVRRRRSSFFRSTEVAP